jgi:hypothetical protein
MKSFSVRGGPKFMLDEASVLDIGRCFVNGTDISPGRAIPDDGDPRIDHSLEGFLFTCGPDHIRHPAPISGRSDGRKYPLHGSFSAHPAEIVFWDGASENGQEDGEETDGECRARIRVTMATGEPALLDRHYRIDHQSGEVSLTDRVTNVGTKPFAAVHMYHMNIGAWLFDDHVSLSGAMFEGGRLPWNFGAEPGSVFCVPAHDGAENSADGGRDNVAGGWAEMRLGPIAAIGGLALRVKFRTDTLPYLQMWRNQKNPAHVLGIEPVSHRLADREELEKSGEIRMLKPGESIDYALCFAFV